ncbi:methionine adenosyltransferase [Candidatus Woesearchaeota archaeon CG_4_10_14_0_2_um_filter_57_5]|nr:MAG: methionine adenosyltransferase [Candidatus Woesearchaeota archaeon CG1_02_57_44]PIN67664.1 MAG: methionine adenosyltransferase [Candidatus Woesearchaeota archaeon CG11_big_fil_rev_8_21_14_0_20_57_5]PIZ56447.1 MAG: methionine adenosyltransferase [Candidatus Woesearchaeota archaeon CG_4_10_14_0_2_um_filter_57_5]
MGKRYYITSESVTEGHPDKVCDQISDAILDELIKQDPMSRVAVECLTTTGTIIVAGEVTTTGYVDAQQVVRATLERIGYTDPRFGIDYEDAGVLVAIHEQSPDIAQGVVQEDDEVGAGDQGIMYGFALNETPELMPLPISIAHKMARRLAHMRKSKTIAHLGPDGKTQVTVEYLDGKPVRIEAVVVAQQHTEEITEEELRDAVMEKVIKPICGPYLDENTKYHINATGRFIKGGPEADTGLTGRKIIVDTYGGVGRHGGGAFSGKDPSKVDRSGAYMARYLAKNVVAAGLATECEVQLSYVIGVAEPLSVNIECRGTAKVSEEKISAAIRKHVPLTPRGIITHLKLRRPIYSQTAAYGHFGTEDPDRTWEKTDLTSVLKAELLK